LHGSPATRGDFPFQIESGTDDTDRQSTAQKIVITAIEKGVQFSYEPRDDNSKGLIDISVPSDKQYFRIEPLKLVLENSSSGVLKYLAAQDINKFTMAVNVFSLNRFQLNGDSNDRLAKVHVTLNQASALLCEGGRSQRQSDVPKGVYVQPGSQGKLLVVYEDAAGKADQQILKAIDNATQAD